MSEVFNPTPKMRVYYSQYHLWAAKHFVKLTHEIEKAHIERSKFDIRHRSYVTNAIFSSVSFMEAAINEFFQDAFDRQGTYYSAAIDADTLGAIADLWRLIGENDIKRSSRFSILEKYQLALTIAQKERFDVSESLHQDAKLVTILRNALVHYKPKTLGEDDVHHLKAKLEFKFAPNKLMIGSGNPFFPDKCLGHGCAEWAVNSILEFVDDFFEKFNIEPNYQRVDFGNH